MRVRSNNGLLVAGLVAFASVVVAIGDGDAAVKKCTSTQVALTVSGKRTCVPRAQFRPTRSPRSEVATFVGDALARPINAVRKRDKRRVVLRVRPALAARMTAKTVELEAVLRSAVQAALAAKTNDRAKVNGAPGVTITRNADGSVTGSASTSLTSGGDTATVGASITGQNVGGQVEIDFGVDVTVQKQGGSTISFGFTIGGLGGPGTDSCPNADGLIRLDDRVDGAVRRGDVVKVGGANLGTFRSSVTFSGKVTATARMSPDANLTPFRFAISQKIDIAVSTRALAFINMQQRVAVNGSLTGTIEPASGQITGAAATINVVMTGISKDDAVATRTKARIDMEKALRDEAGRLLKKAKAVEKKARDGECTKLVFNPATPAELAPNGNINVTSRLETVSGEPVQKVKWTATAAKGSVSPASASTAQPSWTITGAADGPEVARIPVRAVSPAGISEVPWVGGLVFPRTYSGSVALRQDLGGLVDDWRGNFTWVRSSIQQNPDKSQLVRYTLTSGLVSPFNATVPAPSGFCTGGSTAPNGTVVFGDLEIFVDAAGSWRSAFMVDVDVADFAMTCPPPDPPFPGLYPAKAVLNSRQMPGSLLRPMSAGGPIIATNVTDVGLVTVMLSNASWNLQPGQ